MPEDPGDQLPDTSTPSEDATPHSGGASALPAPPVPPARDDLSLWMLMLAATIVLTAGFISLLPALISAGMLFLIWRQGRPTSPQRLNVREATREARVASILVWFVLLSLIFHNTHLWNSHRFIRTTLGAGVDVFQDAAGWLLAAGLIVGWADGHTNARLEAKDMEYQRKLEEYQRELEDFKHRGITS